MKRHNARLLSAPVWIMVVFSVVGLGCGRAPDDAAGSRDVGAAHQDASQARLVKLAPEAAAGSGIAVQPVVLGEFRTFREFPATVRPNERSLAEITALIRGRVVDVYADVGQQVKAGDLLAMLYSSDLGLAQSAYLKAEARLYVAEQAFKRANFC